MEPITPDLVRDGHPYCLMLAATRLGLRWDMVPSPHRYKRRPPPPPWLRVYIGTERFWMRRQEILRQRDLDGPTALLNGAELHRIVDDKQLTKDLLAAAGVPSPAGRVFHRDQATDALLYAADQPFELCVKPNQGRQGDLVFPGLRTAHDVASAIAAVIRDYDDVLIERSMPGQVWRFIYVDGQIVGVKMSRPASVLGDGHSTVAQLIDAHRAERQRRQVVGHHDLRVGHAAEFMLARQGMTYDSAPEAGLRVYLHPASNGAMGADSISMPGLLHETYLQSALRGFKAIPGLLAGSIDMMVGDPTVPATADNHAVLEVNGRPGLLPYHYPWEGPPQDVTTPIVHLMMRLVEQG